ncbi:hypothetical protein D3C81_498230 [compost metagenome]
MMAIYSKTAKAMLIDLINEGNPSMPFAINETDFEFSVPEVIAVLPNGHNTKIRVMSKPSSAYIGNVVVTYRRLSLANIFRSMIPEVEQWFTNNKTLSGAQVTTLYALLPQYSAKYGITLEQSQFNDVSLTTYNGVRGDAFSLTAKADSWAYVGSASFKWTNGEQTLQSLLPVDVINGRLYPGGNNFAEGAPRKRFITSETFDIDFTSEKVNLENSWLQTYPFGNQAGGPATLSLAVGNAINNKLAAKGSALRFVFPSSGSTVNYKTVDRSLEGLTLARVRLPNANYPEANAEFYNSVLVLTLPADCEWGVGRIYLHYNIEG